jgi:hypothetical protein
MSTPPAPAGWNERRVVGSIRPEHTKFVTAEARFRCAKLAYFVRRRLGGAAERPHGLWPVWPSYARPRFASP